MVLILHWTCGSHFALSCGSHFALSCGSHFHWMCRVVLILHNSNPRRLSRAVGWLSFALSCGSHFALSCGSHFSLSCGSHFALSCGSHFHWMCRVVLILHNPNPRRLSRTVGWLSFALSCGSHFALSCGSHFALSCGSLFHWMCRVVLILHNPNPRWLSRAVGWLSFQLIFRSRAVL